MGFKENVTSMFNFFLTIYRIQKSDYRAFVTKHHTFVLLITNEHVVPLLLLFLPPAAAERDLWAANRCTL